MSKSLISTGINPNDGNGDTLLAGAGKINSNFNEIYSSLGNGSDLNIGVGKTVISTNSTGNVGIGTTNSPSNKLTVKGNTSLEGNLVVSGVSTFSSGVGIGTTIASSTLYVVGNQYTTGILTATTFYGDLIGTAATVARLTGTSGTITNLIGTAATITALNSTNASIGNLTGTNATITNITGTAGTITTFNSTNGNITNITNINVTVSNLIATAATITDLNNARGTITNLTGTGLNYSGVSTVGSLSIASNEVISSGRQLRNITSLDATTTSTIESAIQLAPNNFNDLRITGISTFTDGPVLIGSGTSTGTASQRLQVTGGAHVSGNVAIGETVGVGLLHVSSAGPVIVGSGTSTGTALQRLQVTGGGYFSDGIGLGATNPTSLCHIGPGTLTRGQLEFTSGSLLTSPSAGTVEYDGTTLFATPNTSYGRASIPTMIYTSGAGTVLTTLSEATPQILFPSANDTISLPIGTYRIEFGISMTRAATSVTAATLNITLNGFGSGSAGTFSGIADGTVATTSASGIPISGSSITSSIPISVSTNTASSVYTITFTGILRITTAGTFQPRYNLSTSLVGATGSNTISAANYMILQSIATSGSTVATGGWA